MTKEKKNDYKAKMSYNYNRKHLNRYTTAAKRKLKLPIDFCWKKHNYFVSYCSMVANTECKQGKKDRIMRTKFNHCSSQHKILLITFGEKLNKPNSSHLVAHWSMVVNSGVCKQDQIS